MSRKQYSDLDFMGASRCLNLPAPISPDEPARLADLNSAIEGLAWKDNCRVASQSNLNLSAPGASIDVINMAPGDRVLVLFQTAAEENGIYIWNGTDAAMTRSTDSNTSEKLENAIVPVDEGTSAGTTRRQTSVNFTLGTDPVVFVNFNTGASQATETLSGISELATQAETDSGADDQRIVTPFKLANHSGRKRKLVQAFGTGSATQFDFTHNWGTRDVTVEIVRNSAPYDTVEADITRPDTNTVRINTTVAPTANQFLAVLIA